MNKLEQPYYNIQKIRILIGAHNWSTCSQKDHKFLTMINTELQNIESEVYDIMKEIIPEPS